MVYRNGGVAVCVVIAWKCDEGHEHIISVDLTIVSNSDILLKDWFFKRKSWYDKNNPHGDLNYFHGYLTASGFLENKSTHLVQTLGTMPRSRDMISNLSSGSE